MAQARLLWQCDHHCRDAQEKNDNFPSLPPSPTSFIYISSIPAGMHTGNSGISDPKLNCCRAEQETWQVLGEAELLCKCSNFTESMNFKRSFKGMFLNSFINSISGMFLLLDFQKNCQIMWFYFVYGCFAVL